MSEVKREKFVLVTASGVQFGGAWFSHEGITGYSAEQLNSGQCSIIGRQYIKWLSDDSPSAQSELAALREELAMALNISAGREKARDIVQQRLADAERRNAAVLDILSRFVKLQLSDYEVRGGMSTRWQPLIDEAQAALTKPEEAKS